MPQKYIYSRSPLISVTRCFPANGTIRTEDERIASLYRMGARHLSSPFIWEGMFRAACLLKARPLDEPVAEKIRNAIAETDSGAFEGTFAVQIATARAAYVYFDYSADASVLQRLAFWFRYVEIEFNTLSAQDGFLYHPADLMELLVQFYRTTGLKAVLRLCSLIRSSAFDWTTTLHTFQQSIPLKNGADAFSFPDLPASPDQMEYDQKEKLMNDGRLVADGVRYTLYSGLFSGNHQDLSAGRTVWEYLSRHHHAICGGTTGNPYFSGSSAAEPVSHLSLFAWTEAFCAQLCLKDSEWALDELIRIVYNGLEDCLNHSPLTDVQYVNELSVSSQPVQDNLLLLAGALRAAASAVQHSLAVLPDGISVLYLLPARYLLKIREQNMVLQSRGNAILFRCDPKLRTNVEVYLSRFMTSSAEVHLSDEQERIGSLSVAGSYGKISVFSGTWNTGDLISVSQLPMVYKEKTHHRGICLFRSYRLLSLPVQPDHYSFAYLDFDEDTGRILLCPIRTWPLKGNRLSDIPVLPETDSPAESFELVPYTGLSGRLTLFPRSRSHV